MKNKTIVSSVVGASFFAVGYLGLMVPLAPALALGALSFAASELIISGSNKKEEKAELTFKERIMIAKEQVNYLKDTVPKIEDEEVQKDLKEITISSSKILARIEENELQNKTANKFLDYYLPVCVKIIGRYDEIEDQNLTSRDSKEFIQNSGKILDATNKAFKKILNSLYQNDIVDADVEMKVFNSMLKSDGYNEDIIDIEDGDVDE